MFRFATLCFAVAILTSPYRLLAQQPDHIPGDILVMLTPGGSAEAVARSLATVDGVPTNLRVVEEVSAPMRAWLLHYEAPAVPQQRMLYAVRMHPQVQLAQNNHVVEDRIIPNDPQFGQQWHHVNGNDADIDSEKAWDITTGGVTAAGDTIVVCIIENCDLPHPDLIGNAWFNHQEIPNNGIDDDGNGYVDDHRGWNPGGNNDNVYGGSHGTQVAGMIGARGDNGVGVSGANWNVKMMVVTRQGISEAQVISSYTYPLVMRRLYNQTNGAQGAFVVATNASWGVNYGQPADAPLWCAMYDTLGAAGVLSCGATANLNIDIDTQGDLPTACPSEYMVSVTATNNNDLRTFSAYGATHVDVGAPGENVYTTSIGGGYGSTSGTSFASPLTAGVIALLYSAPCPDLMALVHADPVAGAQYVRDALYNGVDQAGNLGGQTVTGGRINAFNSLDLIMADCGACPNPQQLQAANTIIGEATLSWAAFGGNSFNLRYRAVGEPTWIDVPGLTGNTYNAAGLQACTNYEFEVESVCDTVSSGFGATYTWLSEGCCDAPPAFTLGTVDEDGAELTWGTVLAAGSYEVWIAPAGTGMGTPLPGIPGTSFSLTGLDPCTEYDVQVRSTCGNDPSAWSPMITFTTLGCGACRDLTYCASASEDDTEEWIANVTLANLNNNSTGNNGGYTDHTGLAAELQIGDTYTISLTPGFSGTAYNEHFRVWIDLDHDGQFNSPGELVFAPAGSNSTVTGPITVPVTATPGTTRMRVIMRYNAPANGPCMDQYSFGETEDYCVELAPGTVGITPNQDQRLRYFPNPADRDVFFDLPDSMMGAEIRLLDTTGRLVASKQAVNGRATLTTAFLPEGLYVFQVWMDGAEVDRGKVVVAHLW